jgi:glycosyltransferase involved in cell wall biosynthesis
MSRLAPDVLNVFELHNTSSAQAARWRMVDGPPVVVCCYENLPFSYESSALDRRKKRIVSTMADHFVAVTPAVVTALTQEGIPEAKITQLTFGVDLAAYGPQHRSEELRRSWGIRENEIALLYAGRLIREKGVTVLVRALQRLAHLPVRLVVAGEGPERAMLLDLARRLGVAASVRFLGWLEPRALRAAMASADVLVMPSLPAPYWEEQLGFAAIEAMASGVPVVATRTGSLPWVVGTGGVLVPPNDPDALAAELARLSTTPSTRLALSREARRHAERQHDAAAIAREYADLHLRVARTRRVPSRTELS